MKRRHLLRGGLCLACLGAAFTSCFSPTLPLQEGQTLVDSTGGVLATDAGARVDIPAGAVTVPTAFSFRPSEATLPFAWKAAGPAWLARPEGTQFALPVTVTLPVSAAADQEVRVATARQGSHAFELLDSTHGGATVSAQVSHFSVFVPVVVAARDGGAPDPDPDADAGPGDPRDAGPAELPDASRALTCAIPDAGYCILFAGWTGEDCLYKSPCSDLATTREVRCSGAACTCGRGASKTDFVYWDVPWSGDCSADGYREAWTCGCGFPVLLDSPPCPDAGVPPGSGLPLGSTCATNPDCASKYCFSTHCTQACDDAEPCPCGFACRKDYGVCVSVMW